MTANSKPEVVVVTGSSGGVGRAIAHAFAKRGAHVGLLARGQRGPGRRQAGGRVARRAGAGGPDRRGRPRAGRGGRGAVEEHFGDDRRVGQRRDGDRVRAVRRHRARGVQARDRGHLSRRGVRDDGRAEADDRARPGQDRAGRLGAGLPRDPVAGRLLRLEVRDPRVHRLDPHRAAARQEQGADHDGPAPGVNTTQFNWCRSKLPKHPMPVPPIYQPEIPAEAVYWAAHHRRRELWVGYSAVQAILGNRLAPSFADWYLARTGFNGQQVQDMPVGPERGPTTCSSRSQAWPPRTGSSTTRPRPAAPSCGRRPTAGVLAGALAGVAAAGAAAREARAMSRGSGARRARRRAPRTSCASTRCSPTASAASSSDPAATSPGCAFRAGTRARSSRR